MNTGAFHYAPHLEAIFPCTGTCRYAGMSPVPHFATKREGEVWLEQVLQERQGNPVMLPGRASYGDRRISRSLAYLLRHAPADELPERDERGWVPVTTIMGRLGVTRDALARIVAEDSKTRYTYSPDREYLRANQGHSVPVDLGLKIRRAPAVLYHGTNILSLENIKLQGILPMKRHAVHLSSDEETAHAVGARHKGHTIVLKVDTEAVLNAGFDFTQADNGVWLVPCVPASCIMNLNSV